MKKMFLLTCLLTAGSLFAANGIAADQETENPAAAAPQDLQAQALEQYIRATLTQDAAKRIPFLLKSLELDPDARPPMQMLLRLQREHPEPVVKGLLEVARKHPDRPILNATVVMSAFGVSPDVALAAAGRAVENTPDPEKLSGRERAAYIDLVGIHVHALVRQEKFAEAEDLLAETIDRAPKPEPILYEMLAVVRRSAARKASAERRWLGLRASERSCWLERADEAVEGARKTDGELERLPEFERRANFYIRMRCFADARRVADAAVKKFTSDTDAEFMRLGVLLRTRQYQKALDEARRLVKTSPASPACQKMLAECALRCGKYDEALKAGRKLLELQPKDEFGRFFTVTALVLSGKLKEAKAEIALVKDAELRTSLEAVLLVRTRDWSEMLARLRKLQKNPNYKGGDAVYISLLNIAEQTRDAKLLEECWSNMEKLGSLEDPSNANNVGYVATVLGVRLDDARKLIERALKAEPDNGAYLDSMAWICHRQGDDEKAWEYIQQAIAAPDDGFTLGVVLDHAGDIALKLGKKTEALEFYRQARGDYLTIELDRAALEKKIRELEK